MNREAERLVPTVMAILESRGGLLPHHKFWAELFSHVYIKWKGAGSPRPTEEELEQERIKEDVVGEHIKTMQLGDHRDIDILASMASAGEPSIAVVAFRFFEDISVTPEEFEKALQSSVM